MSARSSAVKLTKSTKAFLQAWERAKVFWLDRKGQEFEKDYIESLPNDISAAVRVIEEIDKIISKARRDCEE
jgi:hypothetical protein